MSDKIPYVISEAHPDIKRPWLNQTFGTIDKNLSHYFFIKKIAEFIYERTNEDDIKSVDDINKFWDTYYEYDYMDNSPWDAKIFVDGKWSSVTITESEILEHINKIKVEGGIEHESYNNEDVDVEDWELTDEECELQQEMQEFIEHELEPSDLELMNKMNQIEQTIYVLNKCIINISSEKYKSNKELFYKFSNVIIKYIEKDISVITEEMEENHTEELSTKLNIFMKIYGSLLEYKTIFNTF